MGLQSEGWFNLPQMANPGTTAAFAYVVPASGLVAGLPSPQQLAGNDLILSPSTQGVPIVGYGTTPRLTRWRADLLTLFRSTLRSRAGTTATRPRT